MKDISVSIFQILERKTGGFREDAERIKKYIKENIQSAKENVEVINIDFKGITLVTHSFADEISVVKEYFEKQNKKVEFINMNEDVRKMTEIIHRGRPYILKNRERSYKQAYLS
ncbi:MAG: STAS-like domain-containing protein [Candidatus Altiarchaeum hamiconexum]|uniref:STAS-like domain-containing protein n=1 Tax=Candidatus Altarchaeum hamiconexum TaxID=1803513 RepID=A0A8J7Z0N5_9ARCH|nr:STAS-like domain-containing protein [Candidatus Altarchaeum hamiconexum]OIQ05914.1 MAG: hypothetical protein AUK59_01930 [Candidatus Altarchaeum sp. CG2_30_32_3053]PIN67626.1 MAG: hypothetical protein COV98_02190 [Candidatus Altarchaeum sp. CG12_big_fil_rev_8_21_14_0_65_33_22]PIV27342.1 MAG: hypothetical protein COS36_06050 [Candidatus Altarchaeum sp. CG03_land_8_20_14_0_80_32_618]PIX48712.1 MAG: hypothetical protein COZ53_03160 [Candidatus Altarchaeum sp. CG_4_8_14_3_um_filter_33_2054]PIZ3